VSERVPSLEPYSRSARAISIAVRTAHVGAMAVVVGGSHFSAPGSSLGTWTLGTVVTGLALLVSEMRHSRHWIHQGRGVIALAHLAPLALLAVDGMERAALAGALIAGAVGSHLPRSVRKFSLRHGRVVE
jgi:hypothetical protein